MSMVIAEVFGHDPVTPDSFGYEIELENVVGTRDEQYMIAQQGLFHDTEDGSLRNNGREFVSQPLAFPTDEGYGTIIRAIKRAFPHAEATGRCGLHIHMNVRDLTTKQLARLLVLYCMVESIIFKHTGERDCSHFCVPWMDSENAKAAMTLYNTNEHMVVDYIHAAHKYAALNIKPVRTLGTVESRHMPASVWDTNVPLQMTKVLLNLKNLARRDLSDAQFRQEIWDINTVSNYEYFLGQVFDRGLLGVDIMSEANHKLLRHAVFYFKCNNRKS